MSSPWMRWTVRAVVAVALPTGMLMAQPQAQPLPAMLVGQVRDSGGKPITGAEVWIRGSDLYAITNDIGGFRLPGAMPGATKVSVRRMGYEPSTFDVTLRSGRIDSLVVALTEVATRLPGVLAQDEHMERSKRLLAGFWDRRARGFGHYYTRDEIEKQDPRDFTDIVRMTAGVQILTMQGRKTIRFSRSPGIRGDCPPQYFVDGMRVDNASPDEFPPHDVEAVELYSGISNMPAQFATRIVNVRTQTCGAIVIWTRLPGE